MTPSCLLYFLVLCYFPLLLLAHPPPIKYCGECTLPYHCENIGDIYFPLTDKNSSECGLRVKGCDDSPGNAQVQLGDKTWYKIMEHQPEPYSIIVEDRALKDPLLSTICGGSDFHYNLPPFLRSNITFWTRHMILYKCNRTDASLVKFNNHPVHNCPDSQYDIHYLGHPEEDNSSPCFNSCSKIKVPIDPVLFYDPNRSPFEFLTSRLHIQVYLTKECEECFYTNDTCFDNKNGTFYCHEAAVTPAAPKKSWVWKVIVGSVVAGAVGIIIIALFIYRLKRTSAPFKYQSRNISGHPHSNGDLESSSIFFGIPLFSYKELEEATNNFDRTRELGEGGFGIVYHGKLRDGRDVAVKRLYAHNYKTVQQFTTEIEILTRLRHNNLVILYGCTSRHSRELLLVYEYIPNGTVACHLHGELAQPGSLPWPVRMRIAIETASALTYLHASDTIHRDVKTNNILLDNQFCVKVADFGLSRLFPTDVTHVSTTPQGTPGYLDPEYHRCYQLTSKSDVYSFGVVLIELISSMPAVDLTRLRDEINLSNLAIKKIQNSALRELVDPSLGFESDNEVKRMILSVAELAFQCLQTDKELRPSMDQVLRDLEEIANGTGELENLEEEDLHEIRMSNGKVHLPPSLSPKQFEVGSLKNMKPPRSHQTN